MGRTVPFADRHRPPAAPAPVSVGDEIHEHTSRALYDDLSRQGGRCPACGAGPDQRVPSAGFGATQQTCQSCGYDFPPEE